MSKLRIAIRIVLLFAFCIITNIVFCQKPIKYFLFHKKLDKLANYAFEILKDSTFSIEVLGANHRARILTQNRVSQINFLDKNSKVYLDSIGVNWNQAVKMTKWLKQTHTYGILVRNCNGVKYCKIIFGNHLFVESVKGIIFTSRIDALNLPKNYNWKRMKTSIGIPVYYYRYTSDFSF